MKRRHFIQQAGCLTGTLLAAQAATPFSWGKEPLHISTNQYSWQVFYKREDKNFGEIKEQVFEKFPNIGLGGFEPSIGSPADVQAIAPVLKNHGLAMRSIYVNSVMHEKEKAEASIQNILAIAEAAKEAGTKIFVTNPTPIRWGGKENKSDEQLKIQADALNKLGAHLHREGLVLAYHNHDIELRQAAREFHHMMVGTDPQFVTLCLDAHWIYRGAGNSTVALYDIMKLYGDRVSELHLRQSQDGVWAEVFGPGDIDYTRVADYFKKQNKLPHLVLEQAVEKGTPQTLTPLEAHKQSVQYVKKLFG